MSLQCSDRDDDDEFSINSAYEHEQARDRELLSCCYCGASLEPIMLNTDAATGDQRILWACINMRKKICFFPMGLPNKVFYVTRTPEEKKRGFIPKPNIQLLPPKYRRLYPSVFHKDRQSNVTSHCGTSMSMRAADVCSNPLFTQSPTTSRSSVSSDNTAIGQPLQQDQEDKLSHQGPTEFAWCETIASGKKTFLCKPSAPSVSGIGDGKSVSTDMNSDGTCSSTEATDGHADEALSDCICDCLHEMGVDINQLENEELMERVEPIVKELGNNRRCGYNYSRHITPSEYRVSSNYLYNIDAGPIKRRCCVVSTEATQATVVMRSRCDVHTMLSAVGGGLPTPAPPVKRAKTDEHREELKRLALAKLKVMADKERDNQDEVSATANATSQNVEPSCSGDWYEEEAEAISSVGMSLNHNAATEEEQLSASVENTVRSHIANSAARRKAYQRERMQGPVQHVAQPCCAVVLSPPPDSASVAVERAGDGTQFHECEEREANSDYGLDSDVQNFADIEFGLFDDLIY